MSWRYQLPVRSPITGGMVAAAARSDPGASAELERQLQRDHQSGPVLLTGSGTIALTLALAGRGARPRVALPAWGCPDLATAADGADASVRLYDLDPTTLGPDLGSFERAVAGGIDAAVVVSFFGVPFDGAPVSRMVRAAGGLLIDDAAQGIGGSFDGRPLGGQGDLGVLSFGRGKGRTGGSGGALVATSPEGEAVVSAARARLPVGDGRYRDALSLAVMGILARPSVYRIPMSLPFLRLGETIYHRPSPLIGIRAAAAGAVLASEAAVQRENAVRREAGRWWTDALRTSIRLDLIPVPPPGEPGWLRFPVVLRGGSTADFAALRPLGVMAGYPRLLGDWDGFGSRLEGPTGSWPGPRTPGARVLAERLITLPTHGAVRIEDRRQVVAALA